MSDARLPARLEVSAMVRAVESAGGFAAVLAKGEPDAGTILVVITHRGEESRLYERMPQLDGTRGWVCTRRQDPADPFGFSEYLDRRRAQDRDAWIVELDVEQGERFIGVG